MDKLKFKNEEADNEDIVEAADIETLANDPAVDDGGGDTPDGDITDDYIDSESETDISVEDTESVETKLYERESSLKFDETEKEAEPPNKPVNKRGRVFGVTDDTSVETPDTPPIIKTAADKTADIIDNDDETADSDVSDEETAMIAKLTDSIKGKVMPDISDEETAAVEEFINNLKLNDVSDKAGTSDKPLVIKSAADEPAAVPDGGGDSPDAGTPESDLKDTAAKDKKTDIPAKKSKPPSADVSAANSAKHEKATASAKSGKSVKPVKPVKPKKSKLKFSKGDKPKTKEDKKLYKEEKQAFKQDEKIDSLQYKTDLYGYKRDIAKSKQPTRKKKVKERFYDESKNKAKTKIRFDKEPVPMNEAKWNTPKKQSLPTKGATALTTAGINKLHMKVYEVEHENAGTQTAHRAELVGESTAHGSRKLIHSTYRYVRNTPYRKEVKFETKSIKTRMKLDYQKAVKDNPKLKSNPMSRFMQKRKIKRQYATALRNAKKTGKTAKKTAGVMNKAVQTVVRIVRRNPIFLLKVIILMLIIFMIMALFSTCAALFSGGTGFIGATTYAAEDEDINQADLSYSELKTDLLFEALNAETSHPGYDEYRWNIGSVGHNPLELMAFLTAVYQDFKYADVESDLLEIFNEQYQLTFVPEVEIRTRIETHTDTYIDDDGNEIEYEYEVEVEYEFNILNITLTSQPLSSVIFPRMSGEQLEHYALLVQSRGNRQYVGNPFDFDALPYITSYYGYRIHPITGIKDLHRGLDIGAPEGTEIRAGLAGTVTTAAFDGSFGNYVVIETVMDDGSVLETKYAHCHTLLVSAGQTVSIGDVIATVGSTGDSTGAHLHVEILKDSVYMNPIYFMVTQNN